MRRDIHLPRLSATPVDSRPFPRSRLESDPLEAASALIGALLVRDAPGLPLRVGRIVEVEAYGGPEDLASHARAGRTPRTSVMFGAAGHAYVYLVYGMHHCLNVVSGPAGSAGAVLLRAVEPLEGTALMREARADAPRAAVDDTKLASGPGRLCLAFGVDRSQNGLDLCAGTGSLRLERPRHAPETIALARTPRIGVTYASEPWASQAWRVIDRTSAALSGPSSNPRGL
ncbi:MAG: DNA-3-methyladenine glycosylase [Candidatus Limnocylindrales bacterium]